MQPRPMTPAEKQRFAAYFPNLDVNKAVVTDGPSPVYNCISWTLGLSDRWLWPGNTLALFDIFYHGFGYGRSAAGAVAVWGRSPSDMTHGSVAVSSPKRGPRWESKCGADLRIQHGLAELLGSSYGHVVAFYSRRSPPTGAFAQALEESMSEKAPKSYLSAAERKALAEQTREVSAEKREAFAALFDAWKQSWFNGGLAISSDPRTRTVGKEFDRLIALGPSILPLLVEKLADPENFLALQLYDAIQPDPTLRLHFEPDDPLILEGEQGRARRVVHAWFANR